MLFFQESGESLAAEIPAWWPEALLWLLLGLFVTIGVLTGAVWVLVSRLGALQRAAGRLENLDDIERHLRRLVTERDDLDLRRIERVLVDQRDAQKRVEDALLSTLEKGRVESSSGDLIPAVPVGLGERVTNRLLALGYERVQLVTRSEKLSELAQQDGEVLVEARRAGVLHKGRVVIRAGRIADVEITPSYSIFP